jgi:hypothetical protein
MKTTIYVPDSLRSAGREIRLALAGPLEQMPGPRFVRAWCSLFYLFPGLHPDGFEDTDSGWPRALKRFAAEAWRRAGVSELADEELYPSDSQWSGLYDRMTSHTPDETERRMELAASFGHRADA